MMEADNPLNNPPGDSGLPDPSSMGLSPTPKKTNSKIGIIIGVALAFLLVIAVLVVIAASSGNSSKTDKKLKAQYDAGYQKAKTESLEKEAGDTRIYKAASEFGSFELPIPKNWSLMVTPKPNDGTFSAIADPGYINTESTTHVFKFDLKSGDYDKIIKDYDALTKKTGSDIKGSDVTVSAIKGRRYVGTFDSKNKIKSDIVIVPYREKVLIIKTDDPLNYSASLNTLLGAIKLNP